MLCRCGSKYTHKIIPFMSTDIIYQCDDCYKYNNKITAINKTWMDLDILTIDQVAEMCGMFYGKYQCSSAKNTEGNGMCHTFACPLAVEMDDKEPRWEPYMEGCDYMLQHSEFADT